ncbi:uncharacterized protein VNE69_03201 [Vairimorpha necatrix]|uniref:Uncharacterized protein n=1 Tax=Vairimorpha necatrix TaxID=6039 RepID=A0AAX4JAK6_9MICR
MDSKKRYNEKNITKNFLTSKDGISFLSEHIKDSNKGEIDTWDNLEKEIDNIIDYFSAWSIKFPLKRVDKCSKYEFIKFIEEWCDKNDMLDVFSYLYK